MKEKLQQKKSCFKEKNTGICKIKGASWFFQLVFDSNSGILSPQQKVTEFDGLKQRAGY